MKDDLAPSRAGDAEERSREPAPKERDTGYDLGAARRIAEVRREQLEEAHEENARLRETAREAEALRAQVSELRAEVARLSAAGYLAKTPRGEAVSTGERPFGVQEIVDQLGAAEQVRSAVIADEMGFVVASSGELSDVLGAFGTFLADAAARATVNLPVGEVKEVRLRGENDLTICAHRTPKGEGERLILTVVEVLPETPEDTEIRDRLAAAAARFRT